MHYLASNRDPRDMVCMYVIVYVFYVCQYKYMCDYGVQALKYLCLYSTIKIHIINYYYLTKMCAHILDYCVNIILLLYVYT